MAITPRGERLNICVVGKTNVGKSSIINKIIGQNVSIISEQAGTTTDAVSKRYELTPIGAVTFFDTPGYDDHTFLGEKRLAATMKVLYKADLAILVLDERGSNESDLKFIEILKEINVPFFVVQNKVDLSLQRENLLSSTHKNNDESIVLPRDIHYQELSTFIQYSDFLTFSIYTSDENVLKNKIISKLIVLKDANKTILKGLVEKKERVILVIPIDSSAPKGRIILPQVQVLREILDVGGIAICCTEKELAETLSSLKKPPKVVITDSQVLNVVHKIIPEEISLTTFSILFARYRGELETLLDGLRSLKEIKSEDYILIAEGCSHHKTCEDIGDVKIPMWLEQYLGFTPKICRASGSDFPDVLSKIKLVIHCGACMQTRAEMLHRIDTCQKQGVPITNFGMLISEMNGILDRATKLFRGE